MLFKLAREQSDSDDLPQGALGELGFNVDISGHHLVRNISCISIEKKGKEFEFEFDRFICPLSDRIRKIKKKKKKVPDSDWSRTEKKKKKKVGMKACQRYLKQRSASAFPETPP